MVFDCRALALPTPECFSCSSHPCCSHLSALAIAIEHHAAHSNFFLTYGEHCITATPTVLTLKNENTTRKISPKRETRIRIQSSPIFTENHHIFGSEHNNVTLYTVCMAYTTLPSPTTSISRTVALESSPSRSSTPGNPTLSQTAPLTAAP